MGKITNKSDNFYWWIAIVSCQDKDIRLHKCYRVKIRIFNYIGLTQLHRSNTNSFSKNLE